jgi:ankyrin repeat protein
MSALHFAAANGHDKAVILLLNRGASVTTPDKNWWTPLHAAAHKGHMGCCTLLLDFMTPVDQPDRDSMTPLHWAAKRGHLEVVTLLVQRGAKANAVSKVTATGWRGGGGLWCALRAMLRW